MRAAGFEPEDYADDVVEIWPDCWESVQFFIRLSTQWRHGFGGPTGLDYSAVLSLLRAMRFPREKSTQIFDDVQIMERAALVEMHKK